MLRPMTCAPALLLLTACGGYSVHHDFDLRANFQAYRSYDWTTGKQQPGARNADGPSAIQAKRVSYHVDHELAAKGFKRQQAGDPDFLIAFTPVFRTRTVRTTTGIGLGMGLGRGPMRLGTSARFGESYRIPEGSILLEVFDFRTRQLVWQSVAEGALSGTSHPEEAEGKVAAAVRDMLAQFPPSRR
jgi:hypothetical protein